MKLVMFSEDGGARRPGVLNGDQVCEVGADLLPERDSPQAMRYLIDRYQGIRGALENLSSNGRPLSQVKLHAPLPQRQKMLCALGNTVPGVGEAAPAVFLFVKGGTSVADPGATVELPNLGGREVFTADASVGLVMKGPAYRVAGADWKSAVFGYVGVIDITARTKGLVRWAPGTCVGASGDAFAITGPVLVTADELAQPEDLQIRQWNNGELVQDYRLGDMVWQPGQLIETATIMATFHSGDVIGVSGDPVGQAVIQDGDALEIEVSGVGRLSAAVTDPLGRKPDRSIRVGAGISMDASIDVLRNRAAIMAENAL